MGFLIAPASGGGGEVGALDFPEFDSENPDHIEHLFENWDGYANVGEIDTELRADGGKSWERSSPGNHSLVADAPPWGGGSQCLEIAASQPGAAYPNAGGDNYTTGVHGTQDSGDPSPFLTNVAGDEEVGVFEFAFKEMGEHAFQGKVFDYNGAAHRHDFDNRAGQLGAHQTHDCDDDPAGLCPLYYADAGDTLIQAIDAPPTSGGFQWRSLGLVTGFPNGDNPIHYSQNRGWSQFQWGSYLGPELSGDGPFFIGGGLHTDQLWRRWVIRFTRPHASKDADWATGGWGRYEAWIDTEGGSPIKTHEFLGDPGQVDAGKVWTFKQGAGPFLDGTFLPFFNLIGIIHPGSQTRLGYVRAWSHPRVELS